MRDHEHDFEVLSKDGPDAWTMACKTCPGLFQLTVKQPDKVRCEACVDGRWETECCNGSSGCSCRGQVIDMGPCNVCHGTGWRDPDADVRANARTIEGLCYIGSGPRY